MQKQAEKEGKSNKETDGINRKYQDGRFKPNHINNYNNPE